MITLELKVLVFNNLSFIQSQFYMYPLLIIFKIEIFGNVTFKKKIFR